MIKEYTNISSSLSETDDKMPERSEANLKMTSKSIRIRKKQHYTDFGSLGGPATSWTSSSWEAVNVFPQILLKLRPT